MKPVVMIGVGIVTLGLVFYTIGVAAQERRQRVTAFALAFLVLGVFCDAASSVFMILGAERKGFPFHALLGYPALAAMAVQTLLAWRHRARQGEAPIPRGLSLYTRIAWAYWIVTYIMGGAMVAYMRRAARHAATLL